MQNTAVINGKDSELNSKNQQISTLNSQISDLNQQEAELNAQISELTAQVSNLQSQNASQQDEILKLDAEVTRINNVVEQLKGEISQRDDSIGSLLKQLDQLSGQLTNLQKANLITSLYLSDKRENSSSYPNTYHLTIDGTVFNGGVGAAYNASLRVLAYYVSDIKAIDTTISLNGGRPIQSGQQISVMNWVYYEQGVLKNYTVTPIWSNAP